MSNRTTKSVGGKPSKPHKDFPLFPHASGQWAKKVRGRLVYFGKWADPQADLDPFSAPLDALQARPGWWGLIMGREGVFG